MKFSAFISRYSLGLILAVSVIGALTTGCVSNKNAESEQFSRLKGDASSGASEELRPGDVLKITFKGPVNPPPDHEERIPESGQISLQYIGKVDVIGKTREHLQDEIQSKYVPDYFKELTVTIAPADRFFFVYGEVKIPNRYPYGNKLTVSGAISTAGGFTDFAKQTKVQLIRADNKKEIVNCKKGRDNPAFDPEVLPGDRIYVPRRYF